MVPPLPLLQHRNVHSSKVTEDTPPDLLEGSMDLNVELPSGKSFFMSVHRSTPMMDLLVQVTSLHRINPGGHVIQVVSDNKYLAYKPSTPIGTLDTTAIRIVAKNKLNELANVRKDNLQLEAHERNIRLKVNLPRNQLAVYRVPPKSTIATLFTMICNDKNLDPEIHEIRHPVNVDERLRSSRTLAEYQLQEVTIVSSDFRPPPLSVTDLITMSSMARAEDKKSRGIFGLFSRKAKSSTGDSSVSSGSAGERSVSPAQSDESADGRPNSQTDYNNRIASSTSSGGLNTANFDRMAGGSSSSFGDPSLHNSLLNINSSSTSKLCRPVSMVSLSTKKKRAPAIPTLKEQMRSHSKQSNGKVKSSQELKSPSCSSSDSSGYHEPHSKSPNISPTSSELSSMEGMKNSLQALSNLTTIPSASMMSISSKSKRKAPLPPKIPTKTETVIPESPDEVNDAGEEVLSAKLNEVDGNSEKRIPPISSQESEILESLDDELNSNYKNSTSEDLTSEEPDTIAKDSGCSRSSTSVEKLDSLVSEDSKTLHSESRKTPRDPELANDASTLASANSLTVVAKSCSSSVEIDEQPVVEILEKDELPQYLSTSKKADESCHPNVSDKDEIQIHTVNLSSESSEASSLEMINLKDIQKPKRHQRKSIPQEFMMAGSPSSSHSKVTELPNETNSSSSSYADSSKQTDSLVHNQSSFSEDFENEVTTVPCESPVDTETSNGPIHEAFNNEINLSSNFAMNFTSEYLDDDTSLESNENQSSEETSIKTGAEHQEEINEELVKAFDTVDSELLQNQEDVCTAVVNPSPEAASNSKRTLIKQLKVSIEEAEMNEPRIVNMKLKPADKCSTSSKYNLILSKNSKPETKIPLNHRENHVTNQTNSRTFISSEGGSDARIPTSLESIYSNPSTNKTQDDSIDEEIDTFESPKNSIPGFSISTYQSRANKLSYGKKLSRSESLSSVNDLSNQQLAGKRLREDLEIGNRLARTESRRNEVLRISNMKRATSTSILSNVESTTENKNMSSLFDNLRSSPRQQSDSIQFDLSSAAEPLIFNRPVPKFGFNKFNKTKANTLVRGFSEEIIPENPSSAPSTADDECLTDEYKRLQDDFLKWQQQLMQNQQVLHNRVVPIASNPPSLSNTGMVNAHGNQQPPPASGQTRRPVEISIPIRYEDTGEVVVPNQHPSSSPQLLSQPIRHIVIDQTQNDIGQQQSPFSFVSNMPMGDWHQMPNNSQFNRRPNEEGIQSSRFDSPNQPSWRQQQMNPQNVHQNASDFAPPPYMNQPPSNFKEQPRQSRFPPEKTPDVHPANVAQGPPSRGLHSRISSTAPSALSNFAPPPESTHFAPLDSTSHFASPESSSHFAPHEHVSHFAPPKNVSSAQDTMYRQNQPDLRRDRNSDKDVEGRFSSVLTLKDEPDNNQRPQKATGRSVVQLNNKNDGSPPFNPVSPFVGNPALSSPNQPVTEDITAPVSTQLVRQVNATHPASGPEWRRSVPQHPERAPSDTESRPTPPGGKFCPIETSPEENDWKKIEASLPSPSGQAYSPPQAPSGEIFAPPTPPPPPSSVTVPSPPSGAPAPPPPPPSAGPSSNSRRQGGPRPLLPPGVAPGSVNDANLDARGELMMAIRQFGGSNNLRRSPHPPCQ